MKSFLAMGNTNTQSVAVKHLQSIGGLNSPFGGFRGPV